MLLLLLVMLQHLRLASLGCVAGVQQKGLVIALASAGLAGPPPLSGDSLAAGLEWLQPEQLG